jgi:hypothetical protein
LACRSRARGAAREIVPGVKALIATVLVFLVAACTSSTSGHPSAAPAASGSTAGSAPAERCRSGAEYCDSFSAASSGWPRKQTDQASAAYQDGRYDVTAFHLATVVESAPVDIRQFASDRSVTVSAVATPGHFLPPSALGLSCSLAPGGEAYVFLVDDLEATLGIWNGGDGSYRELVKQDAAGVLHLHEANRLAAQCLHVKGSDGGPWTKLVFTVNGTSVLTAQYRGAGLPGNGVGVAVHGNRAEVGFDDFAVSGS